MVVGRPQHGTNSAAIGYTEVEVAGSNQSARNAARLAIINAPVKSPVALGSSQCNIVGLLGLKRKRNKNAKGLCYTVRGNAPPGWNGDSLNKNFSMTGPFEPEIGVDLPALRMPRHENASPSGDRALAITSWTRRNFVIKK